MNKEFIPPLGALALKELGFDEPCIGFYKGNYDVKAVDQHWGSSISGISKKGGYRIDDLVLAPTFSQAFRWFRDKYELHSWITIELGATLTFCWVISGEHKGTEHKPYLKTYEEAEIQCLERLISIVNEKQATKKAKESI